MKTRLLQVGARTHPRFGQADTSYEVVAVVENRSLGWVNRFTRSNVGERGGDAVEWWAERRGEHYPYYFGTQKQAVEQLAKAAA